MSISTREHEPSGLAFDPRPYLRDYHQLINEFGEAEGRRILADQIGVELLTHVAELERVKVYPYYYLIRDGVLVKNSEDNSVPIRQMFEGQTSVVANLWREVMIPRLEQMPVGASAFSLSAKADYGIHEGEYDFAYFFFKERESRIACFGIELDLSKSEQGEIINRQFKKMEIPGMMLSENPSPNEVRSQAIFYEPGEFDSISEAFTKVVGESLNELRGSYGLADRDEFERYVEEEIARMMKDQMWTQEIAKEIVEKLRRGEEEEMWKIVSDAQMEVIRRDSPWLIYQAMARGQDKIMLPCGAVQMNFDLEFTAGDSLVEGGAEKKKCVTCPFCHQTVDAIVTSTKIICPKCGAEADR